VGMGGLLLVALGGRGARLGLLSWAAGSWLMLVDEALNIKAYDRLLAWTAVGLFLGPLGARGLLGARRGPAARWYLLLVYMALYGSTGWLKLLEEPRGWWSGEVLRHHLLHPWFGGREAGVWLSTQPWLLRPMSWWTVAFEALFPLLVLLPRANPWVLLAGAGMHLGIFALLDVGPFSFVALACYPILLHPQAAERLWLRLPAGLRARLARA
jgi:hypothetical protein